MEIEDKGNIDSFEVMPAEQILYLSAVTYDGSHWFGGPASFNKNEVIKILQGYTGVSVARIYRVKVPVKSFPGA
ncbi:hypothetical protein PIGBHMHK_00667 [Mycoplasmopsis arginini]|uniref:hypothetical protein n=1 Tax=Mycoplasmopsis arginini TaxID=2094 RepID=UPI00249DF689|nr:hypothetical protein [Mycoplasmopsis arginini]MDI3349187.1 hypothetical protein [Mycoplasmopsis arginini]